MVFFIVYIIWVLFSLWFDCLGYLETNNEMLSSFEVVLEAELILDEEIFCVGGGTIRNYCYMFLIMILVINYFHIKLIFKDVGLLTYY